MADENLVSVPVRPAGTLLSSERFQRLADVPPEAQWFANLDSAQTRRAYKNDLQAFMTFTGIVRPEEFRSVTRGHILAWRADLEDQKLAGSTIRRKLAALASLYEYALQLRIGQCRLRIQNLQNICRPPFKLALNRGQCPLRCIEQILRGCQIFPAVMAKVNSYSTRNRFAMALKELGNAVRTTYLLEWVMDESLRRTVHKGTTKIERHHKFSKHLAFGAGGHLRSNNPADQEKAIVYNELVANAVALQTVVDQTQALHTLKSNGISIRPADLAFLSPYATSKLKRFGDYPTDLKPEAMPTCTSLPL